VLLADGPKALERRDAILERLAQWSRVVTVDPPASVSRHPGRTLTSRRLVRHNKRRAR